MHATCRHMHSICQTRWRWTEMCRVMSGSVSVCIFCCRTAAISAPFTPLSTFRFQPLPAVATHGIDVDITFHYVTSQFSAFGRLGVARRFLALLAGLAGLAGLAVLAATTCSHPQLPVGAGGEAMGWAKPPHHIPPRSQSARPLSTPKINKIKPKIFSNAS